MGRLRIETAGDIASSTVISIANGATAALAGTTGSDEMAFKRGTDSSTIETFLNGGLRGVFHVLGTLEADGLDGDDRFAVRASDGEGLTLDGQEGSDDYVAFFGDLAAPVNVDDSGLSATDVLTVNGTSGADVINVTATHVTWGEPVAETVSYGGMEDLVIDAGDGDDEITVNGSQTTIRGGLGDDTFVVNANGSQGLDLDGQDGSDSYTLNFGELQGSLAVDDQGASGFDSVAVVGTTGTDSLVVNGDSITRTESGETIAFTAAVETMSLDGGGGDGDQYAVEETSVAPLSLSWVSNLAANEGASLTLDGCAATDPMDNIIEYLWDLDSDGEFDDASGSTVTMEFADDAPTRTISLLVTDETGQPATATAGALQFCRS
jgi:hypothetical protein